LIRPPQLPLEVDCNLPTFGHCLIDSHARNCFPIGFLLRRILHTYPAEIEVPMESIVRGPWQETVTERDAQGGTRINRLAYEMCVLLAVRERLRSKELWVSGADRYRNPNEDLPADFARERETYYTALNLSRDAQTFIDQLKQEMEEELTRLNDGMESNEHVRILTKDGGWISLSPLPVQPEPANLTALKARMLERWPLTSLLDVFKEADLLACPIFCTK